MAISLDMEGIQRFPKDHAQALILPENLRRTMRHGPRTKEFHDNQRGGAGGLGCPGRGGALDSRVTDLMNAASDAPGAAGAFWPQ
jgi:hypothetical protein